MADASLKRRILHYQVYNTLKDHAETDKRFIEDLLALTKEQSGILKAGSMMIKKEFNQELTQHQCEEIAMNAELHRDACRPNSTDIQVPGGTEPSFSDNISYLEQNRCPCGCTNVRGENLPFCIEEAKLSFMGSSLALSFFFMRIVVATAFTILGVYGLFALITNFIGKDADLSKCNDELLCLFKHDSTLENKSSNMQYAKVQAWLGVAACFLCIIIVRYAKIVGNAIYETVDKAMQTPSDLSIKLENLPFGEVDEQELIEVIKYKQRTLTLDVNENRQQIKIKAIHMVYNMTKPRLLIEKICQQSKAVYQIFLDSRSGAIKPHQDEEYLKNKLKLIEMVEELQDFQKRFSSEVLFRRSLSTTCCIIEFRNQGNRDKFLKRYGTRQMGIFQQLNIKMKRCFTKQSISKLQLKGHLLRVERAPEPQDILWENCEYRYNLMRLVIIWVVTFLIILVSLGVVVGLEYAQINVAKNPQWQQNGATLNTIFNYLISISLMVVNKLLWVVLFYLIKIEYNHTSSEEVISRINKTIIAQSMNCIVVPIITNIGFQSNLYGSDGLTSQILDYSISNAIIPLVLLVVDPGYLIKVLVLNIRCLRVRIINYLWKQEAKTEGEYRSGYVIKVNQLYEGSDFDITSSYVYLIANLLHASFYCVLQPFLLVLTGLGVFLFYYIKKYLLLTRYNEPHMLNKLVFNNAVHALSYVPVFYGVGGLSFLIYIYTPKVELIVPSALTILIGLFNIFNPGGIIDRPIQFFYKLATKKTVSKRNVAPQIKGIEELKEFTLRQSARKKSVVEPRVGVKSKLQMLPLNPQRGEEPKATPKEEQLEDNFRHNVQYYYHNHISTLIGAFNLLVDMPIDRKVRKVVNDFVKSFGDGRDKLYDYPKEASSNLDLLSNHHEQNVIIHQQ